MNTDNNSQKDGFNALVVIPNDESDGAKIWFTCKCCGQRNEGIWCSSDKLFFIGFEESGNFLHKSEVGYWGWVVE